MIPHAVINDIEISDTEYLEILERMRQYGGHFASNLARAWQFADGGNRKLLEQTFGHLLLDYRKQLHV